MVYSGVHITHKHTERHIITNLCQLWNCHSAVWLQCCMNTTSLHLRADVGKEWGKESVCGEKVTVRLKNTFKTLHITTTAHVQ